MGIEYTEFSPPAEPQVQPGPTKADLTMQIEADHFAANQAEKRDDNYIASLEAKHAAVCAATSDEAAREAYSADYSDAA